MPLAAILVRVSTQAQAKSDKHGIPSQLEACRRYAMSAGFTIAGEYVDQVSGAKESREAFYRLLDEADQYDAALVYHLDRVGRDEEISHRFIRLLMESGLEVHAANRGLIERNFMTSIEIAVAAEERRRIQERTLAGRINLAMNDRLPNGVTTYGLRDAGENRAEVDPETAGHVRMMFELSAEGEGLRSIAARLEAEGVRAPGGGRRWHANTIGRMLRNETYKGEYTYTLDGREFHVSVPAIVTPDLWRRAQKRRRGPPSKLGLPLSGRIRCGLCGSALSGTAARHREPPILYYRCNAKQRPGESCESPYYRADVIEPIVQRELRKILTNPDRIRAALRTAENTGSDKLEAQRATLRAEEARLLEAMQKGYLPVDEYGKARARVQSQLAALQPDPEPDVDVSDLVTAAKAADLKTLLRLGDAEVIIVPDRVRVRVRL